MKYILNLSLEQMAMMKVTITLWHKNDIYRASQLLLLETKERGKKWQEIEDRVLQKVKQLSQPKYFKEKISSMVRPIGLEILRWIEYNTDLFMAGDDLIYRPKEKVIEALIIPAKLFWTAQGTIDGRKTAEMLIKDDNIDIRKRYILGCNYCLEKEIFEVWNKMPEQHKQQFYSESGPTNVQQPHLIVHWTYTMKREVAGMNEMIDNTESVYKCAFKNAISFDNFEAVKFFFTKLTAGEINESLVEVEIFCCAETWCFLLPRINKDQEISSDYHESMLYHSFLNWPFQSLLIEVAKRIGNFDESLSFCVLYKIADLTSQGYTDYNYEMLFGEFWQYIPKTHKKYVVNHELMPNLLLKLLEIKDMENFYLILNEASARKCIEIFCFQNMIYNDDYMAAFIELIYISSLSTYFAQFVKEFKVRILSCRLEEEKKREKKEWDSLFEILDDYILRNMNRNKTAEVCEICCYHRLLSQRIIRCIEF